MKPMRLEIYGQTVELDEERLENPEKLRCQLDEYLAGERRRFQLRYRLPDGFQGRVLSELEDIPYGEVQSYGDLASELDTAPVTVGQALSENPLPIIVPCHRVVGKDSTGGYSYGEKLKKKLLSLEGAL
ncbi:MAG: methylated-DNA--[protein]-cysteine S-methyltransferase [Candidatus Nanohaloarchaea archaeon]